MIVNIGNTYFNINDMDYFNFIHHKDSFNEYWLVEISFKSRNKISRNIYDYKFIEDFIKEIGIISRIIEEDKEK